MKATSQAATISRLLQLISWHDRMWFALASALQFRPSLILDPHPRALLHDGIVTCSYHPPISHCFVSSQVAL